MMAFIPLLLLCIFHVIVLDQVIGMDLVCNQPGEMVRHCTPISSRTSCTMITECFSI